MSTLTASLRPSKRNIWAWFLAVAAFLTVLYVAVPPFKGYAALINLIGLMSPVAIGAAIVMHRPKAVLAWSLLLLGRGGVDVARWPSLVSYLERMRSRPQVKAAIDHEMQLRKTVTV